MSTNSIRREKEKNFYVQHMETFKKLGLADPMFTIKTAFFQKGRYGRNVLFFEWELKKGEDIYIEFYDNVTDGNGKVIDIVPMNENRQLFKYKYNPYFFEEYEQKESMGSDGKPYFSYTVPANELLAITPSGDEISYALYEKRKEEEGKEDDSLPKLQSSLSIFPDFEKQYPDTRSEVVSEEDDSLNACTIKDLAAILWKKPVSNKKWLNDLISNL